MTSTLHKEYSKQKVLLAVFLIGSFSPLFAFAQTVQDILIQLARVIDLIVPVMFAVILLVFFWGVGKFVFSVGETGKTEGKAIIFWGVLALFVSASIWGISIYLQQIFGVQNTQSIPVRVVDPLGVVDSKSPLLAISATQKK